MLSCLLVISQLLLMSDRGAFWNPDTISDQTQFMVEATQKNIDLLSEQLKGKNVLLLVHGFNNNAQEALSTYRLINTSLCGLKGGVGSQYDYVIGYLWPGYDHRLEYFGAKHHVLKLAEKMRFHLAFLSSAAARLDVLAHSMGNFLMLEALNFSPSKKLVHNYFSLAPAVDDEVLDKKQKYFPSTQNCEKLFVFYSHGDEVLKWAYTTAEWDHALGYVGAQAPLDLPENVSLINYTSFVHAHSGYFSYRPIYQFIVDEFLPLSTENLLLQK